MWSAAGAIIDGKPNRPAPGQQETVAALLVASGRRTESVPLRRHFVQQGPQDRPSPGPLRLMLRAHDERSLDLYLLFRAAASSDPWDVTRDARVWARCLGLPTPKDDGAAAVSKIWRRLDTSYHLVRRERRGRLARIVALHEAGTGTEYAYPTGARADERYFKLPFSYWTGDEHSYLTLSFPAKAVLLVALSLKQPFMLPTEKAPDWYGISVDSAERGLRELREVGILRRQQKRKENWLQPSGFAHEYRYRLLPPFATAVRRATVTPLHRAGS